MLEIRMFHFRNSQHYVLLVCMVLLTLEARRASANWVNCSMEDNSDSAGSAFLYQGGTLNFHYEYPNVAPINMVYSINGITQQEHSILERQSAADAPDKIAETAEISNDQQGLLGAGTHVFAVSMTYEGVEYSCEKEIQLVEPVSGVSVLVYDRYVSSEEKFKVEVKVTNGCPCDINVVVTDTLSSGYTVISLETMKVETVPLSKSFVWEIMSPVPGNNYVVVIVSNNFYQGFNNTRITVEEPIKEVIVTSDGPVRYPDNVINFAMTVLPSTVDITYDIAYGDGMIDYDLTLPSGSNTVNFMHAYLSPGIYTCHIMVKNNVSQEISSVKVSILEDIRSVSLVAYTEQNRYTQSQLVLPMEYPVKFMADFAQGTMEYCTWENTTMSVNTTHPNYWQRFPAVGWYNITATVSNTFNSESELIRVQILESVKSLYLVNNGPVHLGENITYVLFCKQIGSSPSFKIDMGDGTEFPLRIPQKNPNVTDILPNNLKIPFDHTKYFSTVISHLYEVEGRFIAMATGWNPVSHTVSTYEAFIQDKSCNIPDINIRDGGSNYDSATKYKRSKAFIFAAKVDLDCPEARKADYLWRIYRLDEIFAVPSAANEFHLPSHVNAKVTDLYIPKYLLDYGRYIFEINVVLIMKDGSIGYSNRDQSDIEVVQTPLVAKISGGSAFDIGWSSNITLDGSESYDPDWDEDEYYVGEYHWYCHLSNESLPTDFDIKEQLPKTGGCLGQGIHLYSGNDSALMIEAETLRGNESYVFHLALSKPGRSHVGWAMQTITVLPGNPPTLAIQCLHNCASHMNPSETFALAGVCTDCDPHTKNKYTWTISSDDALPDSLLGFRKVIHGRQKAFLSFPVDTFLGLATYSVKLRIDSLSGAFSRAEYTFKTNSPPTEGSCEVTPSEGVVMETRFTIECQGFADPQGPLLYEAHAFTGAGHRGGDGSKDARGSVVYYGVDPIFPPTLLPVGRAKNDFNVTIDVKVSDNLGASVLTTTRVKVKPPPPENQTEPIEDTVLRLAQGSDSELSQLLASGSMQSVVQLVTSITSLLNAEAEKPMEDEYEEKDGDVSLQAVKLEKRKMARESLIDTMVQIEVRDMESLEQTSAAIAQVTEQQQEVSMEAQIKLTDMYLGMGKFLKDQSDSDVGGQEVESSAKVLVSGLSNIMGAAFSEMKLMNQQNETSETVGRFTNETELQDEARKARNVTKSLMSALKDIQSAILHNKVPGQEPTELQTDSFTVSLARQESWQLDGLGLKSKDDGFMFQLPNGIHEMIGEDVEEEEDGVINTQMYHFKNNPFLWSADNDKATSEVIGLQITRSDESEVPVKNLKNVIDVVVPNPNALVTPMVPVINPKNNETLYAFNWTNSEASVLIQIDVDYQDGSDLEAVIQVCIQYDLPPNATHYDLCKVLPDDKSNHNNTSFNVTIISPYSWLLQPDNMTEFGTYYITVERLEDSEDESEQNLEDLPVVYIQQTQCIYWNEDDEKWKGDGCKVGPYTSLTHTHCQCNHLTFFALSFIVLANAINLAKDAILFLSFLYNPVIFFSLLQVGPYTSLTHTHCQCNHLTFFVLSFIVLPNAVNLAKDAILFLSFLDNPVTVAVVCVVFCGYLVVAIWARKKDKMEEQKAKVIYLRDNDPRAHYRYHITIFTGMRKHAGTTATVTITLYGSFGSSEPHILSCKNQAILQRNSIDSFILTTHQSLGVLHSLRVWHDNHGTAPDWYVSRILVHDLENDMWWYFLCRSWLAVHLGGCRIDKTFEAATEEDLNEFHHLVLSKSVRDLKDNHLWFSVLIKPPQSYFTRLQRATCCLQLLMTAMTMNIIFFDVPENPNLQNLEFGSIQISLSNILVGIQASLMSIPIGATIETIFRYSRPRYVAMPDPLQAHSSASIALMANSARYRFKRLAHRLSQQFHFGRHKSNDSEQGIDNAAFCSLSSIADTHSLASVGTPSLSSSQQRLQEELEWYRRELLCLRSSCQSSWNTASSQGSLKSYSNVPDGQGIAAERPNLMFQRSAESAAQNGTQARDKFVQSMASPSTVIDMVPDFFDTETGLEDDVDLYRLEMCSPLPFPKIYGDRDTEDSDSSYESINTTPEVTSMANGDKIKLPADLDSVQDIKINFDSGDDIKMSAQAYEHFLVDKINECRKAICNMPSDDFSSKNGKEKAVRKLDLIMKLQGYGTESDGKSKIEEEEEDGEEDFSNHGCLPWWFIYIGWFLTFGSTIVCAYFIMQYGLRYGWQTSLDWLVSMMVSVIQSIVIVQPIKVVILAVVFAIFLKTHELDDVGAQFFRNWKLPKIRSSDHEESAESIKRYKWVRSINSIFYKPPLASSVVKAQEKRRLTAKVHSMFGAFIGQIIFVFFVLEIAYTQQNSDSFYLGKSMRDKYGGVDEVLAPSDFFDWMSDFIPETYMDDPSQLPDNNILVGSVRLRQIRVKPDACTIPPIFKPQFLSCKSPLKTSSIDRGSYGPGWAYKSTDKHKNDPWDYQSLGDSPGSYYHVASMGYDTGGFIANLGSNSKKATQVLTNLKENTWINQNTWAVFVEWTVYNANVNLFSINTVLFEVDTIGNLDGSSEHSIVRIHRYTSQFDIFVRVLEGTYVVVVLAMIYRDYHKWKTLGSDYFDFWNWLNLAIISSSVCAIVFYILHHGLGLTAMKLYKEDRTQFVSFSRVAFINQLVIQFILLIVFCATMKCAKVLRYNSSIFMLQRALRNVSRQFASFTFGVFIAIICFVSYAFLEFGRHMMEFRTFMASLQTLFISITGGLDNINSVVVEFPIRSFFFFIALTFFGIFVIFQLYASFILSSFEEARHHPSEYEDQDVITSLIDWILDRFKVNQT